MVVKQPLLFWIIRNSSNVNNAFPTTIISHSCDDVTLHDKYVPFECLHDGHFYEASSTVAFTKNSFFFFFFMWELSHKFWRSVTGLAMIICRLHLLHYSKYNYNYKLSHKSAILHTIKIKTPQIWIWFLKSTCFHSHCRKKLIPHCLISTLHHAKLSVHGLGHNWSLTQLY